MSSGDPLGDGLPLVGDVLAGKYRVEGLLGEGGMGVVLEARHVTLEQPVAVKLMRPAAAGGPEIAQRFLREARAVAALSSEHIVRVYDADTLPNGLPFFVMERLRGEDVARRLQRSGKIPVPQAVAWLLDACKGLAEAHGAGIVHRDLKPSNLFLTKQAGGAEILKVLDFGIAKSPGSREAAAITTTGALMGSLLYMAPEQLRSAKDVDARADVWALGAILYEVVSGDPTFARESTTAVCAAILEDQPEPLTRAGSHVPPELEKLVFDCLEKDRARRPADVAAVERRLHEILAVLGTAAPLSAASERRLGHAARVGQLDETIQGPLQAQPAGGPVADRSQSAAPTPSSRDVSGRLFVAQAPALRFEPLPVTKFPLGQGPFRVRGLAYGTMLDFVDKRLPGGRAALRAELGARDPYAPYLDQLFVASADYDMSPLVRLYVALARLKGMPVSAFVERRSSSSAVSDVQGVWKPLLKTTSPEAMAKRLPLAFNRYFQPCEAHALSVEPGHFEGELTKLPAPMAGLLVSSTAGFVTSALQLAAARDPRVVFHRTEPDGELSGVPLLRCRFSSTWSAT
jgi:eukaryotic-like serine/threonine-protein kinase